MAFFKFRQRGQPQPEPTRGRGRKNEPAAPGPQETIDTLRRRARHRLIGAAVLVGLAIIGFPLLFDTQPRPVAVNAPITIPDKDKVAPLRTPDPVPAAASLGEREEMVSGAVAPRGGERTASASAAAVAPARRASAEKPAAPTRDARPDAAAADARAKAEEAARLKAEEAARAKAAQAKREEEAKAAQARRDDDRSQAQTDAQAKREEAARAKREQEARAKRESELRAKREEAARARALLEGRGTPSADKPAAADAKGGRFIVQVGAFADDSAVREARQKAERAGVKTYTQTVETSAGKRTRVRAGPFSSREDADKAAGALKKAGLGGSVLSL
ncbi:MAG TPA: SPOR domain-containing protein [Ottowia sp.]|jgi:DedD protein|nr:SPOR domain-containing protein [Ottowia sp.]MBP7455925.1 SPOR domain-containing protein [Ottowia sp.]MBP8895082.1 SPOR domain-containing protein [Ottowia sp.]HOP91622.1 SPOR domain-containing protein [Ottowia sp.]